MADYWREIKNPARDITSFTEFGGDCCSHKLELYIIRKEEAFPINSECMLIYSSWRLSFSVVNTLYFSTDLKFIVSTV